jgi:glycosyltransferase involved in cell wall biosynthesis
MKIIEVGSESVHFIKYCKALDERLIDYEIIAENTIKGLHYKNQNIFNFRSLNPLKILISYYRLKIKIKISKPHLIHIHQINRLAFFVCVVAKQLRIPIISTAWGSDVLTVPKRNILFKFITTYVLKKSKYVTADSKEMITAMESLHKSDIKYHWIQYGIDSVEALEKGNYIFSNRIHRAFYRIDLIIEEFKLFVDKNPNWKLIIAAEGEETNRLKLLAQKLLKQENYEFVGWLDPQKNADWYGKSKIYISIPLSDGTSVSLLEAMLGGCIPIVSDINVSYEWIKDNKNGLIFKPNQNIFERALKIDYEYCVNYNKNLIKKIALRKNTMTQFLNLYTKSLLK